MSISMVPPHFTPEINTNSATQPNFDDKLVISVDERGRALRDLFYGSPPPAWVENGLLLENGHWQMQLTLAEALDLLGRLDAHLRQTIKDVGTTDDYICHLWEDTCTALGQYR